ncbi:type I restriction enzyme, S subunit [Butyrivibrio fibrisolvens]|uniref:Type I restriction enzyme, S subunit n=1 Tax=Butyrivibrio fibrisolvens TaxID=831 RepID=A0A1H9VIA6_BUTFI|nr:restriction endonuclease subunit S [Butyrivibrio fibrisolvens]SES20963.1 type I restriction enzyme, S subunit [Butyrivibrio fibrisolvens]
MANTPKIRFKGFTDDWEQRKFSDFTWSAGKRNKDDLDLEPYAITNEHGFIRQSEAHDDFGYMKDTDRKAYNIVMPNSFAYNPARINVGSIGYYEGTENVIVSSLYEVFQTADYVDDRFLWHWFKSEEFPRWIERLQEGSVRLYFYYDKLCECQMLMPSVPEQQKIAKTLDELDNLITLHQRKCDETKELKKYMLQKMFPKNGNKKPEIRFSGFTDDWEQRKLFELSSSFEYGLNAAAKEYDGENKYIRITDIDDESHEFKQDDLTSPDTDLSVAENYKLSEGDILFARTGASVGKSYIYKASDGLVYYAGFLIRARIKEENNPEFVYQNTLTNNYEKFIQVTSMRSGQPGVNAQEYSQFEIMIPSKAEQDKIAYCFRNLDNLITLHQRKCDNLKEVKKYMLQNMFPQKG